MIRSVHHQLNTANGTAMRKITSVVFSTGLAAFVLAAGPAEAQRRAGYRPITGVMENNTGGRPGRVIARGATGASTITRSSAAGGNAQRPELAVPNGSAGGGSR